MMANIIASLMLLVAIPMFVGSVALWWHGYQQEQRWLATQQEQEQSPESPVESEQRRDSYASTPE